ncbi:hypothetical protein B0H17DRAFT_1123994 [Mycena rosella]|uniref:Uncharacterized protein n=1 Tax=Mycena rosella TaxID=1033263 RepID=A0AAD7MCM2_MYCRO|nr:hypothetical protein B0H17DRAFT_1123994 [Mycena rosella]
MSLLSSGFMPFGVECKVEVLLAAAVVQSFAPNDSVLPLWYWGWWQLMADHPWKNSKAILAQHKACISVAYPLEKYLHSLNKLEIIHLSKLHVSIFTAMPVAAPTTKGTTQVNLGPKHPKKQTHGIRSKAALNYTAIANRKVVNSFSSSSTKTQGSQDIEKALSNHVAKGVCGGCLCRMWSINTPPLLDSIGKI